MPSSKRSGRKPLAGGSPKQKRVHKPPPAAAKRQAQKRLKARQAVKAKRGMELRGGRRGRSREQVNTDDDEWQPTSEESQHEKEVSPVSGGDSEEEIREDTQPVASLPVSKVASLPVSKANNNKTPEGLDDEQVRLLQEWEEKKRKEYKWISPMGLDGEKMAAWEYLVEEERRQILSRTNGAHEPDERKKAAASLPDLAREADGGSETDQRKKAATSRPDVARKDNSNSVPDERKKAATSRLATARENDSDSSDSELDDREEAATSRLGVAPKDDGNSVGGSPDESDDDDSDVEEVAETRKYVSPAKKKKQRAGEDDEQFGPDTRRDVKVAAKYHIWKKVKFIDGKDLHKRVMRDVVKIMSVPDESAKLFKKKYRAIVHEALGVKRSGIATSMKIAVFRKPLLVPCFALSCPLCGLVL